MLACKKKGHLDVVIYLKNKGADVNTVSINCSVSAIIIYLFHLLLPELCLFIANSVNTFAYFLKLKVGANSTHVCFLRWPSSGGGLLDKARS